MKRLVFALTWTAVLTNCLLHAQQLDQQVDELYGAARFADAVPLAERSLALKEQELGTGHIDVATSFSVLAKLHLVQGDYAKAQALYLRALAIRERALGPLHNLVARSLSDLAVLYQTQGAYTEAKPLYLRAITIYEKTRRLDPDWATCLNNLATLYEKQGDYASAEHLTRRALNFRERVLGAKHPDVAQSLNNLAVLYKTQGDYARAERLHLRAIAIYEQVLGNVHPDVARSLNNLAVLYQAQGAYRNAELLYVRAIDIRENALGPLHPDLAKSLNNFALLYQEQGSYEKAEPLYGRALAIYEKVLGPEHPNVALSLHNLAAIYWDQGDYANAESHLVRALAIYENVLGPQHPDVAKSLNNLAALYQAQKAYAKAEPILIRALAILESAAGSAHPDVTQSLTNLATVYQAQGNVAKTEPLLVRAASLRDSQLHSELARLSERRKLALMLMLRRETELVVSFHVHDAQQRAVALELALTTVLRNKGRVLDSLADNQATLRATLTPPIRKQLDRLTWARANLTAKIYHRKGPEEAASRRNAIDALRTRIDELESSLSAASAEFRSQTEPVTIAKVQAALPAGSGLVELVRYQRFDARDYSKRWKEERYLAYVLRPTGPPTWVALGEAGPIDAEVEALRAGMYREPGMAHAEIERRQQQARAALQKLHGLLMAPLASSLQGVSHLLIAPDGKLNLVPFEALVDANGNYVLQRHLVSYLSSGRDLLRLSTKRRAAAAPTIVAAPDYGPGKTFAALPGALAEGQELRRALPQGQLLTGRAASKEALAKLVGPSMLHVATHGFYARGGSGAGSAVAKAPPRDPTRGMFIESFDSALPMPPPPEGDELDALDRAGLALAGANSSADGIITAREIAGLNWSGTQLVVLSACETGIGAVATGEGVYGLRRALVLSGAQAQVVSLWNVADASTLALMKTFYAELARGTGRAEALRRAKLSLLQEPRYAHPYYWAPFIPAGDWRPLDSSIFAKAQQKP